MVNKAVWEQLTQEFAGKGVTLIAVSKTKPVSDITELYVAGQRDFGENYVQELVGKQPQLPADIRWHYIGHLQSNKVKYIAPFVHLVHAVDDIQLLAEISKQALRNNRVIDVLLQIHIAKEEAKFGMDEKEVFGALATINEENERYRNTRICGLMGMATNTDDLQQVRSEFAGLHALFNKLRDTFFNGQDHFSICSMGMSGDYRIAIEEGSNMVRIGSLLFGSR